VPNQTRQRILDAALACFTEDGYEQTTIARIRERSGASNGALFHHFATKEAIADALYVAAIASFQQGLWNLLDHQPSSLRDAVHAAVAHQLGWTEQHPDLARFVYLLGHPAASSAGGAELGELNRELAGAVRRWMAPFAERGEIRTTSMLLITAIVGGPAHAVARRWLAGQVPGSLTSFTDELADAAWAGLRGTQVRPRPVRPAPARGRVTIELLDGDGTVVAHGQTTTPLAGTDTGTDTGKGPGTSTGKGPGTNSHTG
jgi:AcrR family transcriptional regulator